MSAPTLADVCLEPGDVITYSNEHGQVMTGSVVRVYGSHLHMRRPDWPGLESIPAGDYRLVGVLRTVGRFRAGDNDCYCDRCHWHIRKHGDACECPEPGTVSSGAHRP